MIRTNWLLLGLALWIVLTRALAAAAEKWFDTPCDPPGYLDASDEELAEAVEAFPAAANVTGLPPSTVWFGGVAREDATRSASHSVLCACGHRNESHYWGRGCRRAGCSCSGYVPMAIAAEDQTPDIIEAGRSDLLDYRRGEDQTRMTEVMPPMKAALEARRSDTEFTARLQARIEADEPLLRRLATLEHDEHNRILDVAMAEIRRLAGRWRATAEDQTL